MIDIGRPTSTPSVFSSKILLMNRKDIISLPNDHLRRRSKKVTEFDDALKTLVDNMKKVTLDWEDNRQHEFGVALAAVQIDVHEKVIVVRSNFEDKADRSFMAFVNPKIISRSGKPEVDYEGCLSVPDVYGKVPRYPRVKIRAKDENGDQGRGADGEHAHEIRPRRGHHRQWCRPGRVEVRGRVVRGVGASGAICQRVPIARHGFAVVVHRSDRLPTKISSCMSTGRVL